MRTSNPALSEKTFNRFAQAASADRTMTIQGTVNKSGILLALVIISAAFSWTTAAGSPEHIRPLVFIGAIGGLIAAIITCFKVTWAPFTAPVYALLEGLFLGAVSYFFEAHYQNIVFNAVMLTLGTLVALLMAYKSGLIKATEKFKAGVMAATGAIFLVYMVNIVLSVFSLSVPFLHSSGLIGIGISLFIVIVAALNLVLDFDFIEKGAERGAPKFMEWYGAFCLMVTLIWLYLEFLRLLAKLNRR